MYKAIKDNHIIAISDTDAEFMCLVKDKVVEDAEHTVDDYDLYYYDERNAEYLLKTDIPAPSDDEQSAKRELAYIKEVDPITSHIQRLKDEEQTEEIIAKIAQLITERTTKVEEIKARYPYSTGENNE